MQKEKLAAFVIPYFGTLPNYFPVFLRSCEINRRFDWLLFTDDRTNYNYPENVKVTYITFDELRKRAERCFPFEIALPSPKKLCDFKPTYGLIFEEELKAYDYWGYCDIDLVLGDLSTFIDEEELQKYKKHFYCGHMSIYENTEEMNTLFMKGHPRKENPFMKFGYLDVLCNGGNYAFDEWMEEVETINEVAESLSISVNPAVYMLDIRPFRSRFYSTKFNPQIHNWVRNDRDNFVVAWENGKLYRCSLDEHTKKVQKQEISYAHFQKRKMHWRNKNLSLPSLFFYPNQIKPCAEITDAMIRQALRRAMYRRWIRIDETKHRIQEWASLWKRRLRKIIKQTARKKQE